ncbi:zinc-dependent alcohol dehydrogenase [Virgisporangium aurantiacum]|uniref:Threonine dehydrogenase n=1 Tax=Virgisporangium aurantiacum TaxID=175570 RepID=A0A8J3ZKC7_9ACTN|nr:alcohol dehydrogenase catalytic domain-containing protein [Virgisporangium aurantiacum]GIJ63083.1 threonine dehydrogenase [Virgisporangium aurantiacum]
MSMRGAGRDVRLLLTGASRIEVGLAEAPRPGLGEVVIEVSLTGICGSEVEDSKTLMYRRPPVVMGHEIVGRLPDGSRVAVNPLLTCGDCAPCRCGRTNICASREVLGIHRPGGFAPYVAVPRGQVLGLPDDVSDRQAVMVEPLANGLHAWNMSGAGPATKIAVLGAGPIGLSVALAASIQGVSAIDVVEPVAERRQAAAGIGANVRDQPSSGYDLVIDCVGRCGTRRASVAALAYGGTAVWLGLQSPEPGFDSLELVRTEKTVRGSYGYTADEFAKALALAASVPPGWVTEQPLEDGPAVFDSLWRGELSSPKVALRPAVRGVA